MRDIFQWLFRNRETGAITVVQTPNIALWVVIVAAVLVWIWPTAGRINSALTVVVQGGVLVWAVDEIVRGVNPWRRLLGTAVALYELATLLL